jgi:hypothetical protein
VIIKKLFRISPTIISAHKQVQAERGCEHQLSAARKPDADVPNTNHQQPENTDSQPRPT